MKNLITILFIALSYQGFTQGSINSDLIVNAQRSVDGKQYKLVANKHVPYASSTEYLSTIPATRRHIGQIGYIANGSKVDVWQFTTGIADADFHLVSIALPANNPAQDSVLSTDTGGIAKNRLYNPWAKTGNIGIGATDFIGSTNNAPLRFRTNNIERMKLDSLGNLSVNAAGAVTSTKVPNAFKINGFDGTNFLNLDGASLRSELSIRPNNPSFGYGGWIVAYSDTVHGSAFSDLTLKYFGGVKVDVTAGGQTSVPKTGYSFQVNLGGSPQLTLKENGNLHLGPDTSGKPNSALTITPLTPKGILIPRLSRTQRNTLDSSTTGLLIYNTTTNYFEYSAGSHWKTIGDTSYRPTPGGPGPTGSLTDGNYGDITVSLGGTAMDINDSVVHSNNIHDVAASTITGTLTHTFISDFASSKAASADSLVTARNIFGYPFKGNADLTGIIGSTYLPTTIPYYNQANTFDTSRRQTFKSAVNNAGLRFFPSTVDPSTLLAGDMWYNSSDNSLRVRANTTTRLIANLDETQTLTNKDLSSSTNTPPLIPLTKGGSGQTTANASLNAFLPSQSSNAGKVLQSDGTSTSWKVKVDSNRAINDSTLREFRSDGSHYDILFDSPIDSSEHTLGATITFTTTGGTNPSGTTNNTYQWSQSGKLVTVRFNVSWGTVGTGTVSAISFNLPADLPAPKKPTGFTSATDYLYIGEGYLSTTKNSVNSDRGRSFIAWDGTNYNVLIKIQTAAAIQYGYATLQYFVP